MTPKNYDDKEFKLVGEYLACLRDGKGFKKLRQKSIAQLIGVDPKYLSEFLMIFKSGTDKLSQVQKNIIVKNTINKCSSDLQILRDRNEPKKFDTYIYYYFSYDDHVKAALMNIPVDSKDWIEGPGELVYFNKIEGTNELEKVPFVLYRTDEVMISSGEHPQVAFFRAVNQKKKKVNFFTINVKGLSLTNRRFMFLTYSVVETQHDELSCGYGIMVKQENEITAMTNISKCFDSGIDDWIVTALWEKKLSFGEFESNTFKTKNELLSKHKQYEAASKLFGYFVGFFLTIVELPTEEKFGRVIKAVLEVQKSGLSALYYSSNMQPNIYEPRYTGFIHFPTGRYALLNGSFAYDDEHNDFRYHILMRAGSNELSGIFYGRTQRSNIYASPIYFERIIGKTPPNDLLSVIDKHKPRRISKDELISDVALVQELRKNFGLLFEKYVTDLDFSIPPLS